MICVALISGLFFSFSIAVCPGLRHLTDLDFIKAMKSINKEILNPFFLISFFGPILLYPLVIYFQQSSEVSRWLLVFSSLTYMIMIVITVTINVPLNNRLEGFNLYYTNDIELSKLRNLFENRWTFWNNIRTVLSISSLVLLSLSQFEISESNSKFKYNEITSVVN